MQIRTEITNNRAALHLNGRFDFAAHKEFRGACEQMLATPNLEEIEIDLRGVDYLDSSALGMLLLLKERAGKTGGKVRLSHCQPSVRQILDIANFGKLFVID